ncbi:MAG TPA: hypothetical protein VFV14_05590 [Myxococcaceae bacterium]|nr:hypothetical protein [Myxococcaceae bacterium]
MHELATETTHLLSQTLPLLIPIVGSIALFGFLAVASWADARRREREAFFRHELLKKVAESPSGQQVVELLRQEEADRIERKRQAIQLAGWVVLGAGIGLSVLMSALSALTHVPALWSVGVIPALVGAALVLHANLVRRRRMGG